MADNPEVEVEDTAAPHDEDRYPGLEEALRRIISDADRIEGPLERLDIRFFANGDVTYNVWAPRSDEPEGGYLPAEQSG